MCNSIHFTNFPVEKLSTPIKTTKIYIYWMFVVLRLPNFPSYIYILWKARSLIGTLNSLQNILYPFSDDNEYVNNQKFGFGESLLFEQDLNCQHVKTAKETTITEIIKNTFVRTPTGLLKLV